MRRSLRNRLALLVAAIGAFLPGLALAQDESYKPKIESAPVDPEKSAKSIRMGPGLKIDLFAAEPMLANPVSFATDEHGRFYVVETFRHTDGVPDIRGVMHWLDTDLASRTVADRVAMYQKFLKPDEFERYSKEHDRIRLIEDTDHDGKADKATIFADDFHGTEFGIAAGVLARKGEVYFTCIPNLYLLKDTNNDGKADQSQVLSTGYGVHNGFIGHDLHGLKFGPDGRLYFSIGDRALNVVTAFGQKVANLDSGSVLRCEPDGSNLEVFATGLRNPQELAFTETGDLFSVDNNSDGGDRARIVWLVEGSDSGWRIGYQFVEKPNPRGIWNGEKMWYPAWDGQAAYIFPPLANFSDGPSGIAYNPGTGLGKAERNRFFLCDFRGSSGNSGIRSFALKPKGAAFEMVDDRQPLWGAAVTDCDFGPDGALYVTDWVDGWQKPGKGRIWKVTDTEASESIVADTQKLIADGFDQRPSDELARLLGHPDMRVRQEAQFALAARALKANVNSPKSTPKEAKRSADEYRSIIALLSATATQGKETQPRLHAIWGIGQILRPLQNIPFWVQTLVPLLQDQDAEIRAQAAKLLGETRAGVPSQLVPLLKDSSARVRFFTLMTLAKIPQSSSINPIVALLQTDDGRDPYLRHAAVMALTAIMAQPDQKAVTDHAADASPAVRMAVLLAMRNKADVAIAQFFDDSDPTLLLEAARAVTERSDAKLVEALPKLAALAARTNLSEPLWRRVLTAAEGLGTYPGDPRILASVAARSDVPVATRVEALAILGDWAKPPLRNRLNGLHRDMPPRSAGPAVAALAPVLDSLVKSSPDAVRKAATNAAGKLGIESAGPTLRALVLDVAKPSDSRVEALKALDALKDNQLGDVARKVLGDEDVAVRVEATRALSHVDPNAALTALQKGLASSSIIEQQGSLATLGGISNEEADRIIGQWLDRLAAGTVPPEIRLDLVEAALRTSDAGLKQKVATYEATRSANDPLSEFRDCLVGGDAVKGGRIFREKAEVQCLRCHMIDGNGGQVGPVLTGVGGRKDRGYLLESIALPDKQIAQGYETLVVSTQDGQVQAGIVKSQDTREIRLITAEGKILSIPRSEVEETKRGASAMPADTIKNLSRAELRDVIEFLSQSKTGGPAPTPETNVGR